MPSRDEVEDEHIDEEVDPLQAGWWGSVDASAPCSTAEVEMALIQAQLTEGDIAWILEIRRDRSKVFGNDLFSDPAWDILLELFAAKLAGRRLTLGDLAAVAPQSTLARWVAALEERGLVELMVDPLEPDQFWIGLSHASQEKLTRFLSGARQPHRRS